MRRSEFTEWNTLFQCIVPGLVSSEKYHVTDDVLSCKHHGALECASLGFTVLNVLQLNVVKDISGIRREENN